MDLVEELAKAGAARRVHREGVGDAAFQVATEVRMGGAVLGFRAVFHAVVEEGLERV